mmetsp:Transcript_21156/g.63144  ORF Transcript_21156/g.63144 Transcript_21156/m.63144 type:complete len:125 (+) Transcript_21156:1328-1702(+)
MDALFGERLAGLGLYDLHYGLKLYNPRGREHEYHRIREGALRTPTCAATKKERDPNWPAGVRGRARLVRQANACLSGRCLPAEEHDAARAWRRIDERGRNATNYARCLVSLRFPAQFKGEAACT